jgi:hypothetical protein
VSSSTLGIVTCMHVNPHSHSDSLGGRSLLNSGEVVQIRTGSLRGKKRFEKPFEVPG